MDALLDKSMSAQWCGDTDVNWRLDIKRPLWFRTKTYIKLVSQLYHGELATLRLCRLLQNESADPVVREFTAIQLADEERHERVFRRYLERLGDIAPIEPSMEEALERSFNGPGSHIGLILAFHVVFEGGALRVIDQLTRRLPCPLFRNINSRVLPDEARHIAFGTKYVRGQAAALSAAERRDIYEWVRELWLNCHARQRRAFKFPAVMATGLAADWLHHSWQIQDQTLRDMGFGPSGELAGAV